MKILYTVFIILVLFGLNACKNARVVPAGIHTAKVLATTCPSLPSLTEVAVQLDNNDPLSADWKNMVNDTTYRNVIITFNPVLRNAIGRSITYTKVRSFNASTDPYPLTPAICFTYPIVYLDSVIVKN